MTVKQKDYEYRLVIPATPDRVWSAWTDAAALRAWFAEEVELDLRTGGAFRFWGRHTLGTPSEDEASQEIDAYEPEGRLAFHWNWNGVPTRVELSLEAEEWKPFPLGSNPPLRPPQPGCALTIRQSFDGVMPFPKPENLVDDHWRLATGNLMAYLTDTEVVLPDYADPTPEVRVSMHVKATPTAVFRALTEPALLDRWIATGAKVDPRVGGRLDLGWSGCGGESSGEGLEILELVPDQRLKLTWPDWRGDPDVPDQEVSWELFPEDGGTRIEFLHTGFQRLVDRSDFQQGWAEFLTGLAHVAATAG